MSLPIEAMQTLRRFSEMTAGRPEGDRLAKHDEARQVIKGLKLTLDELPDKHLACVSYVIATLMSTLLVLPVPDLAATLDKSAGAYSLASAALLGLYDLTPGSATEAGDGTRAPAHAYLLSALRHLRADHKGLHCLANTASHNRATEGMRDGSAS